MLYHTLYRVSTHACVSRVEGIFQVGGKDEQATAFQVGGLRNENDQSNKRNSGALECVNVGQEWMCWSLI